MLLPKQNIERRKGASLVLVVILLIGLLGAVAFAVDMGLMVLLRAEVQNAVDSAALAGVLKLKNDPEAIDKAEKLAKDYVQLNRAGSAVTIPENLIQVQRGFYDAEKNTFTVTNLNANAIRVFAEQKNEPFHFAKIFGFKTFSAPASAVAAVGSGGPMDIVLVLDLTTSMLFQGRIQALHASAPVFVDTIKKFDKKDQIAVMGFGAFPNTYNPSSFGHPNSIEYNSGLHPSNDHMVGVLEAKLTKNFNYLKNSILTSSTLASGKYMPSYQRWTNQTGTGAALGDSVHYLLNSPDTNPKAQKAVVLMSDGLANRPDGNAWNYAVQMANYAAQNKIPVYTISLGNSADINLMTEIATITKGEHFDARGSGQDLLTELLTKAFQDVAGKIGRRAQLVR